MSRSSYKEKAAIFNALITREITRARNAQCITGARASLSAKEKK